MKKQKFVRYVFIAVIIGILLLIGAFFVFKRYSIPQKNTSNSEENKKILPDGTSIENKDSQAKTMTTNQNPVGNPITMTISQISQNPSQVIVRVLVDEVNSGNCSLSLKKDSVTVLKNAAMVAGPSYNYCDGFIISKSELQKGEWKLSLQVKSNGREGNIEKVFSVE
ncbi:hypothetical protein H0W80_03790 [Candidatus Saccharibacteria bacterium]|nr:hypothetical protein [Candidatus Saccharibacteria bacterium]